MRNKRRKIASLSVLGRESSIKPLLEIKILSHLIIETFSDERVGYIILAGLENVNKSVEFRRIVVTEKNQGYEKCALRLVKKLAFEELKTHRLWLDVKEKNVRARHVYEAEGFQAEGVLRECLKIENGYESLVVMSMLRDEYESEVQKLQPKIRGAKPEDAEAITTVLAKSFANTNLLIQRRRMRQPFRRLMK